MRVRLTLRRGITASLCFGIAAVRVLTLQGQQTASDRQADLVRGNKPGEWRGINGDASSTRFAPLSQIDAPNVERLPAAPNPEAPNGVKPSPFSQEARWNPHSPTSGTACGSSVACPCS